MKNSFVFGGVNSADYNVWISGTDTFAAPERDVEYVSVPGRNGDLIIDNGKWNNIQLTYPAFINKEFYTQMAAFRAEICKLRGYQRLEDTYHPDEFRLASFTSGLEPKVNSSFLRSADFDITFNCKPQRFLKLGEEPIQLMPPVIIISQMSTLYIPVGSDLIFDVNCLAADTLTITVKTYDTAGTELTSNAYTCTNGDSETVTFTASDKLFRIFVDGSSDLDSTSLRIQTITTYNNETIVIDAIFARTYSLINPTGYASKPMIESYGKLIPYMAITTSNNGIEDNYVFNVNDTDVNHFWMDCELQYIYDDSHNNLTNFLFLTTAQSEIGEGLVFPEFGDNVTTIEMYSGYADIDYGIELLKIYPRWWKL